MERRPILLLHLLLLPQPCDRSLGSSENSLKTKEKGEPSDPAGQWEPPDPLDQLEPLDRDPIQRHPGANEEDSLAYKLELIKEEENVTRERRETEREREKEEAAEFSESEGASEREWRQQRQDLLLNFVVGGSGPFYHLILCLLLL
jgi:hypothetical protein